MTPQDLAAYNQNFNYALNDYFGSGNFMLNYGNNTAQDPAQRFMNDTGTQIALHNSDATVGNQYASRGLSNSGALAVGLNQNMFNNYQNWLNTQNANFSNYQNQLSGIAANGINQNGANVAAQNSQQLAGLLSSNNMNAGTAQAGLYGQAGSNIASLLSQQGTNLASLYTNQAAASGQNLFNANNIAYQLAANNQASNAQTQSSAISGQGYQAGGSMLTGNRGGLY